jgi:hypothetical protein
VKILIGRTLESLYENTSSHTDKTNKGLPKINITASDLFTLIKQLSVDNVIQKFAPLDIIGTYICVSRGVPIIIASVDDYLDVYIEHKMTFDYDYGFIGRDSISKLNSHFKKWVEKGDIKAPIIKYNNLTGLEW